MSTLRMTVASKSTKRIRVEESHLLPDGVTWSGIGLYAPGWTLGLTVDEARRLSADLDAAVKESEEAGR